MRIRRLPAATAVAAALAVAVTGCGSSSSQAQSGQSATVISFNDAACGGTWHASPGWHTFDVQNEAEYGAEVDLVDPANGAVYDELENTGPGTTVPMTIDLGSGKYAFLCEVQDFDPVAGPTVTISGHAEGTKAILPVTYNDLYPLCKEDQKATTAGIEVLERETAVLAGDVRSGNLAQAKRDWLTAHLQYQTLGVAYSSFGNYDGEIDGRADATGTSSSQWTGFYRLEYGLWHGQSASELTSVANTLNTNVHQLLAWWKTQEVVPLDLVLRTHEVLENALEFQLTGHDDYGSGTTLATTLANITATRYLLSLLHPLLVSRYPALPSVYNSLDQLQSLLENEHLPNGSWVPVSGLPTATRQQIDAACSQVVQDLAPIASIAEPRNTLHDF
ncbi:MAG TPA: imelysin family protein [Trebonia sp.]|jgi:iron uptake system EfeUOB component EfeO/EfeM|nr:imelysin family protein [Trebonia sp.]